MTKNAISVGANYNLENLDKPHEDDPEEGDDAGERQGDQYHPPGVREVVEESLSEVADLQNFN